MCLIEKNVLSLHRETDSVGLELLINICINMKKIAMSLVALVAMSALSVSCHNSSMFKLTVEGVDAKGAAAVQWPKDAVLATWDDALSAMEVKLSGIAPDSSYATLVMPKEVKTEGVRRFVYPATVCAGEGKVMIAPEQSATGCPALMPCYAETKDGNAEVEFKSLCGVVRLHLTTAEKLAAVQVSTEDSAKFMSGRFGVENYPFPVLKAENGALPCVVCNELKGVDFGQGADVCLFVAPGCYNTFTITLTTEDGRTCQKNLKDNKYIVVDRNVVCTINLGQNEGDLVFEEK